MPRSEKVAAHPRKPLVSETKGLRGWAATLPRAPALGFFEKAGSCVLCCYECTEGFDEKKKRNFWSFSLKT